MTNTYIKQMFGMPIMNPLRVNTMQTMPPLTRFFTVAGLEYFGKAYRAGDIWYYTDDEGKKHLLVPEPVITQRSSDD